MDGLTSEQLKEVARLHLEREALAERMRNIDMIISGMLGLSKQYGFKKKCLTKTLQRPALRRLA